MKNKWVIACLTSERKSISLGRVALLFVIDKSYNYSTQHEMLLYNKKQSCIMNNEKAIHRYFLFVVFSRTENQNTTTGTVSLNTNQLIIRHKYN